MGVHHARKHKVAKISEQYSDYAALIVGAVGVLAAIGAIGAITILPDHGESGLFSLADIFFSHGGYAITWGAALGSLASAFAYGTNQALDALRDAPDSWKDTEVVAFAFAFGFPVAHDLFGFVADITAGEPMMQVVVFAGWGYAMSYLVDL